jgi:alpha-beta hydrolase superfamily lysophospholipase
MRKLIVVALLFCALAVILFAGQEEEKKKAAAKSQWAEQQITTQDGVILKGQLNEVKDAKAMVVLLHMLGKTWETWKPLAATLTQRGYSVFAYDARGHGLSTTTKDGKTVSYRNFAAKGKDNEWNKMAGDLGAVVEYLRSKSDAAKRSVVFIGASIGGNAALIDAAADKSVAAVVLLSPGLNYHDVETEEAAKKYGTRPLLIIASMGDAQSYEPSAKLEQVVKGANADAKVRFLPGPGNAHGTDMLNPLVNEEILRWLGESLKTQEPPKAQ